ncbi:SDR family NAD(P)-dependent oxidoreductase [Actinobaculum massiliense]|uniref:SDR family NAD(P)-dependent oxidoreductase n=1 Tax=Actinobaculum massiliense TaxID=202789 RepID=UPI00288C4F76|nr:SDR family oxidoreductase [Actinobaculum massiliense]
MELKNKTFVVTGAGNGIGREVALQILEKGGSVAGVDLNGEHLHETAQLAGNNPNFSEHAVDISDRKGVESLFGEALESHLAVDGLVNVAGIIQKFVPILELDYDEMEKVMNVNFWGTVNMVKTFLPHLLDREEACIINVSSMGALAPVPGQSLYGASKAAVDLFSQGLYAELRETKVHVGTVFPGAIATNIAGNSGAMEQTEKSADDSGYKLTSPQDAAKVILNAIEKEKFRATIGNDAMALDVLSRVSPKKATEMIAKKLADVGDLGK